MFAKDNASGGGRGDREALPREAEPVPPARRGWHRDHAAEQMLSGVYRPAMPDVDRRVVQIRRALTNPIGQPKVTQGDRERCHSHSEHAEWDAGNTSPFHSPFDADTAFRLQRCLQRLSANSCAARAPTIPSRPRHQHRHDPLLQVQAVVGLREDERLLRLKHLLADLQPAIRRQTMQHDRVRRRRAKK